MTPQTSWKCSIRSAQKGSTTVQSRCSTNCLNKASPRKCYTYTVLIKALAGSGDEKLLGEAKKLFVEMMGKGVGLNAGTCVAILEGLVKVGKEEEGREVVLKIRALGLDQDEEGLKELLKNKRGHVFHSVMNILFGN
ncbi:hypothetical protein L1987_20238 [Smallanthus sonchifolius]|uniref:Uncharacterized protein n=1 Tax=Smallanthus sonchifolius TaxID=185202 RepID=A0ACB9IS17_9ASTR|nr:hypothetical protein L1987_20238 [Smallanthus sonchifolius]